MTDTQELTRLSDLVCHALLEIRRLRGGLVAYRRRCEGAGTPPLFDCAALLGAPASG